MFKKRLPLIAGVLLLCILSCFIVTNNNTIKDEITRFRTNRSLDEAKKEFLDATRQAPLELDSLIISEISKPYIPDDRPECIVSYSYQVFTSDNDYGVIRSMFLEKLASLGWSQSRTERTPDTQINFLGANGHLLVAILPMSEFERHKIDVPDSQLEGETVYAILYLYKNPDPDTCFLAG